MKKHNILRFVLLGFIVFVSAFFRLYHIDRIPPSLSWDEVSIGYNAYSILKTGRDEHERLLPFDTFAGYGDYKPPLSVYATVPSVALFGLNEFAVRLPSALAGVFTVLVTYVLVLELFQLPSLGLLSAFVLAASPWHIQLSRAGFEANIAVFFIVFGMTLIFRTRRNAALWFVALLPFVAAVYTFNSARYFAPLLGVGLLIYLRPFSGKQLRWFVYGLLVAIMTLLPILPHIFSKEARLRYEEVNIFTDSSVVVQANERMAQDNQSILSRIVHNRRLGYARSYLSHFLDHFDPQFLFVRGDGNPKFSIQDVGQMHMIELPFLLLGVYWVLSRHKKAGLLLLFWLITAIIPAAVARETPHALRIENSLPTWQIFIACGILSAYQYLVRSDKSWRITMYWFLVITLYFLSILYYLHNYFIHYPREYSGEWQYGYKQALDYIRPIQSGYNKIYLTESIGRPYMYTLFYEKTDPNEFFRIKQSYFDAAGFYHVTGFGNYEFVGNMLPSFEKGSIYILPPGSAPKGARTIKTIHKLNGDPVLEIFEL